MTETLARRLFGREAEKPDLGPIEPAGAWRILSGQKLIGVLRLSSDPGAKQGRYGFFAFRLEGRGVFEGIYNVAAGGAALHGVFWKDGRLNNGAAEGVLELSSDDNGQGTGKLTFSRRGDVFAASAR